MIDWWTVATTVTGATLVSMGGIIWRKVNNVLSHVEKFARHIDECEQRNENHAVIHKMQEQETNRRLTLLEQRRGSR